MFQDRNRVDEAVSVLNDIAKLSDNFESVALRDAYGREVREIMCVEDLASKKRDIENDES